MSVVWEILLDVFWLAVRVASWVVVGVGAFCAFLVVMLLVRFLVWVVF